MRRTKAFVIVKELCGDAFFLVNASPQELYINAAFESIRAGIAIFDHLMVNENYRAKLQQKTEEMHQKYTSARDVIGRQTEKHHVAVESIRGMAGQLQEMAEYVQEVKKELSRTEEDIRKNNHQINALNDWFIKATKNCTELLEYYQNGDDENA